MSYSYVGLGAEADCAQLAIAAKESTRVAQTMVRVNQMSGSNEKTGKIAQLLRDWSTGTGEPYADMEARHRAKSNADGAAVVAARAVLAESQRVYETMVRVRRMGGSPEKTRLIAGLLRDWGTPGENYTAMEARRRAKSNADGASLNAAIAAAAESARIYQTMVRVRQMSGSPEKTRQIAQLRRDWATSTGESWSDMMARWGVKRAADVRAASECVAAAPDGGLVPSDVPSSAPADSSASSGPGTTSDGGIAGLPTWAWGAIGAGALALIGGALVIRTRRKRALLATTGKKP